MKLKWDLIELVIVASICAYIVYDGYKKRNQWKQYGQSIPYFRTGLLLLLPSLLLTNIIEKRWDMAFIGSFLALKDVSRWWMFRLLASLGYISIIKGVEVLCLATVNKDRK